MILVSNLGFWGAPSSIVMVLRCLEVKVMGQGHQKVKL